MAAPTSFNLACASTTPGSGSWQGVLVWTVTAPWGKFTHPDITTAVETVMFKDRGSLLDYIQNTAETSANEVPL